VDEYKFTLDPIYKELAKKTLREDDSVRQQSLNQMREWIKKDPFIKQCRTDGNFLLRFLRIKKFNISATCEMLYKYLSLSQVYPQWYRNLDVYDPIMMELLMDGFFIPLPNKDEKGRQIIMYRFNKLDHTKYTATDVYRLLVSSFFTMFEDEEAQIAGYVWIFDYTGFNIGHAGMFNLLDFKNFIASHRNSIPLRLTSIIFLKLPIILQGFYQIAKNVLSPKLKKRFLVLKEADELKNIFNNINIFLEEYGGKKQYNTILMDFQQKLYANHDQLLALDEMYIEVTKDMKVKWFDHDVNVNDDMGVIGSFRKLEVD